MAGMRVASPPRIDVAADAVAKICDEIGDVLERKRLKLAEDIVKYPTPIPACDADFNHMLAERARIEADLTRLESLRAPAVPGAELTGLIAEFAALSPDLDASVKRRIKSALKDAVSRG